MATKAQAFRTEQMRNAHPPKPKQPKRPRRDQIVDTAAPGVAADDRSAERTPTRSRLAGKRGGAALENITEGRPSRKSTRRSSDHTKRTTNLQMKATMQSVAPTTQATRASTTRSAARAQPAPKPARSTPKTPGNKGGGVRGRK